MYELDFSIPESISQYQQLISNYPIFFLVLFAMIVFSILMLMNLESKITFFLLFLSTVAFAAIMLYFRGMEVFKHFDSMLSWTAYKNIYFFYWNTILAGIVMHVALTSNKQHKYIKYGTMVFFILLATNAIFSIYITGNMKNEYYMVLGNISPMIVVGNLLAFLLYIYLILAKIGTCVKKSQK